tara:strand:+ start:222 stop:542 length:321 start_codon:yes stop_codon:yes gene_type:complete
MAQTRLERLSELARKNLEDPFASYGLAMEYGRQKQNQKAIDTFNGLMQKRPDYLPSYFQYGTLLQQMGESSRAKAVFTQGIATAQEQGDQHTQDELNQALEQLRED